MSSQAVTLSPEAKQQAKREISLEREVAQIVEDMKNLGLSVPVLVDIALPNRQILSALASTSCMAAKYWAESEVSRRAAAKLLAERDFWDLEIVAEHAGTGYQRFLNDDPFLKNVNRNYKGGPFEFGAVNLEAMEIAIRLKSINELCRMSGDFFRRLVPGTVFANENPELAQAIRNSLVERGDFLSRGRTQLSDDKRRCLNRIIEAVESAEKVN